MEHALLDVPSRQQPNWTDPDEVRAVRGRLAVSPGLVDLPAVRRLGSVLAEVAEGRAHVVQAGDCAENITECTAGYVARKAGLLDVLAGVLKMSTHKPVVRVGRIAGQFAKPRSRPTERVGGRDLPVYRGDMVNSAEPDPEGRQADPRRMLRGYRAARATMRHLGWPSGAGIDPPVWTSHEALLLDYEIPMLRQHEGDQRLLSSTHWPWIGERTRQAAGPHVTMLAGVANPVACKVGPEAPAGELVELCGRLDPARRPGRLTLIARLGAGTAADRLPPLVRAVRGAGHPVIWLVDPMHANTITTPEGLKTRLLEAIVREVLEFQDAVRSEGGVAGGLHLETTPDDVTECVTDLSEVDRVGDKYTTLCDPRLNLRQAVSVVSAWSG